MKIRNKIILLFLILLVLFLSLMIILNYNDKNRTTLLLRTMEMEKRDVFEKILNLKRSPLEMMVFDYTYWDEMVKFMMTRDMKWANENVGGVLQTYKINAFWIYNEKWDFIYSKNTINDGSLDKILIEENSLRKAFGEKRFCHFFINTNHGLMEISGATIHPSNDIIRKTHPKGYFFAGLLWSKEFINDLSRISESNLELITDKNKINDSSAANPFGTIEYAIPLFSWDKKIIGKIKGNQQSSLLIEISEISNRELFLLLIFGALFLVLFTFYGNRWILKPIGIISKSLKVESKEILDNLGQKKSEFTEIADLIKVSFKQKSELIDRDYLLQAIAKASSQLLNQIDFSNSIYRTLEMLGEATKTDRIVIYENKLNQEDILCMKMRYHWIHGSLKNSNIELDTVKDLSYEHMSDWQSILSSGSTLKKYYIDFSEHEKSIFKENSILSILAIPILIEGYFWGFVRFDNIQTERIWTDVEISILMTACGSIGGAFIRKDIDQSLQENESLLRSTTSVSPFVYYVVDNRDDSILYFNHSFCKIWEIEEMEEGMRFGEYKNSDIIPRILNKLVNPEIYEELSKALNNIDNKTIIEEEIKLLNGNIVRFYSKQIRDKKDRYFGRLFLFEDITERKKVEESLRTSEEKLRELNKTKDKFFSIIAHDLRNPLGTVVSFAEVLVSNFDEMEKEELREILGLLNQSASQSMKLFENLLEWARAQTGKIEPKPESFDLHQLIDEKIGILISISNQKDIKLINKVLRNSLVFADKNMIETVIRNLISNAVKFTNPGGGVTIDSTQSEEKIEISISDTGIGISEDKINNLFRIDAAHSSAGTSGEKGTGLGLILCKEFVEKNNGRIWVSSEIGKGSTFHFTLPKHG